MDDVNVGVDVPATTLNSTLTSAVTPQSSGSNNGTNSQISSSESATITATASRGKVLPTDSGKGDLAIFAIIFIIIALIVFALVYRNQLIRIWEKNITRKNH